MCLLRRGSAGYQRNQTISVLIESQDLGHTAPVKLGIEWQFLLSQNLLQYHQRLARGYSIAVPDPDFQHARGTRRLHLVLHLHRLHHCQALAGLHRVALLDQQSYDFSGHGCDDVLAPASQRGFRSSAGVARVADFYAKAPSLDAYAGCRSAGRQPYFEATAPDQHRKYTRLDFDCVFELRLVNLDRAAVYHDLPVHRSRWPRPSMSQLL